MLPLWIVRYLAIIPQIPIFICNTLQLSITEPGWIDICRICHGGESIGDLLAPCRCKGSIALAHMQCLEHWLKESELSRCELCHHHFDIIREPK